MSQITRLAPCNPTLLDFVTWVMLKGCRLFERVHITPLGLVATAVIPSYDFVAVLPVEATQSMLNIAEQPTFPIRVSPDNFGEEVSFFQDLNRGSFAFVAFLTKVLVLGRPRGIRSYLDVLPFDQNMPIGKMADIAQATDEYRAWTAPLIHQCKVDKADFDLAFRHAYCLFRRHAIPFWTSNSTVSAGHPYFQSSPYAQAGQGDIMGMIPVLDLALHSPEPNATIGYPDREMLQWLRQEKKISVREDDGCFVMQALHDILPGDVITVDKNMYFKFDNDTFRAWFGYPNVSQVPTEPLASPDALSTEK